MMSSFGLNPQGQIKVVREVETFNQLDKSKIRKAGIYNVTDSEKSKNGKSMDKISLH